MNTFLFVLLVIALSLVSLSEAKAKRVRKRSVAASTLDTDLTNAGSTLSDKQEPLTCYLGNDNKTYIYWDYTDDTMTDWFVDRCVDNGSGVWVVNAARAPPSGL